ncbi:hypothetical protein Taro_026464 [Colocasia esculenta]|uniref:Uncharacterized protein n=1 Tax=Colocasia esculenta TaxID=4460 RepID=A0A843VNP1_COLES|nr:hypothetical protein [Colocasia esculenta]
MVSSSSNVTEHGWSTETEHEPDDGTSRVNPEAIHGLYGHFSTSRGFRPYLDSYKGPYRYLTIPRLGAACRKPGPGERTSFHRSSMGPTPPSRASGMSQASRSFLDFSEWFRGYSCNFPMDGAYV